MKRLSWLQIVVYLGAILPMGLLIYDFFAGNLSYNPIQEATQRTGDYALIMILSSLACTPINILTGYRAILKIRRGLGLFGFGYAFSHFLMYVWVDYRFDWVQIFNSLTEKRYILVGSTALVILTLLAVTSFKWWMKKLGKAWKWLHRLVYTAGVLIVFHVAWAVKGDLFTLKGDIWKPLSAGIVLILLFSIRLPLFRRFISRLKQNPVYFTDKSQKINTSIISEER